MDQSKDQKKLFAELAPDNKKEQSGTVITCSNIENVTVRPKKVIIPLDSEEESSHSVDKKTMEKNAQPQNSDNMQSQQNIQNENIQSVDKKLMEKNAQPKNSDNMQSQQNIQNENLHTDTHDQQKTTDNLHEVDAFSLLRDKEIQLLKKENELLKKEREIIQRENELLKLMNDDNNNVQMEDNTVSLKLVSNFLPDFDGNCDAKIWITQLRDLQHVYRLSDNMLRALFATKLIGRAQTWLHSRRNSTSENMDELFNQFCLMFGSNDSKLDMRKKFERRIWGWEENFVDYFNDKIKLSEKLSLEEDELVEYVIDAIPNTQIRSQAMMQRYTNVRDLYKSLVGVKLHRPNEVKRTTAAGKPDVRCYNCNSLGHFAADCGKPRREPGTCYACGSNEHTVALCTKNKKKNFDKAENNYVRYFNFSFNFSNNCYTSLECLIDSGSSVSLIKEDALPEGTELFHLQNTTFYGLNYSVLKTLGKCLSFLKISNKYIEVELIVVDKMSMKYPVLLGRDFLHKTNSKIVLFNSEIDGTEVPLAAKYSQEILNKREENNKILKTTTDAQQSEEFEKQIMAIDIFSHSHEFDLKIGENVPRHYVTELNKIFLQTYVQMERPEIPKVRCEMKLTLDNPKPFNCPPRRLSYAEKQELQKILDEYIEKGVIRSSESEFASPIVLVRKKTGDLRMCVDFRNLNKITAKHNYPIPLIDDLLERLGNKSVFSKLDLKNGFYHVFMNEESVRYTSFITPLGQFEFLRMPFGLKNAPSIFQMFINKVFEDLIRTGKVIVYLDDIMIATDNITQHLEILEEVMTKIVENNLELRLDKCEFLRDTIKYLGYTIDSLGIHADEKGLEAINNFPIPDRVRSVQSFLGLCSYFRRFIKNFSIIAKPLYDLTRKDKKFQFGKLELDTFEILKRKLLESPVLALYDPTAETELHCDASALGFGAILMQKKEDAKWHPVFYFSKRSTEPESKFHSYELETLAIVYALRRFRVYLYGKKFKIITDCNSLTLTLNKKELNPRIARWALEMQNFDYTVEHREGRRMQHVDALSRSLDIMMVETNTFEENLIIAQNRDPKIVKLKEELQISEHTHFEMRNGVLYRKLKTGKLLFCVPALMETHVIYRYHDDMGHVGINKVIELISRSYWFPHINTKVTDHVRNCLKCIVFSAKSGPVEGFLHNIPKPKNPFEMIHVDHYGPVDKNSAKKYLFVVVDSCSKFVKLYPTKTTSTKEVIKALNEYFRYYSKPKYIVSDRGSSFTSDDFRKFVEDNEIQQVKIATFSPQANGQVERINRSLGPMIAKLLSSENNTTWEKVVETVEFTLNNTRHRMINEHPSIMLFGVNQRGKLSDKINENVTDEDIRDLDKIREKADEKQKTAQQYNKNYVDSKRKQPVTYKTGDYVVIKNLDNNVGVARKLLPKFKGPYEIKKVLENDRYILEDVEGFQQTRVPYKGIWAAHNMKHWFQGNPSASGSPRESTDLTTTDIFPHEMDNTDINSINYNLRNNEGS